jgi:hypothetical protein
MTILTGEWLLDEPPPYHSILDDRPARATLASTPSIAKRRLKQP